MSGRCTLRWNQGNRNRGRHKNTWRRELEKETKEAGYKWGSLEKLAEDRCWWRDVSGICLTKGVQRR